MYAKSARMTTCLLVILSTAGCATDSRYRDSRYDRGEYREDVRRESRRHDVRCNLCGRIEFISTVWVDERSSNSGTLLGAIIGGVIGNQVGSGDGRRAATVAGAVVGGVIGHEADRDRRGQRRALRFELRLDDGRGAVVTQFDDPGLDVGDRAIIRDDRVYPLR